MSTQIKRVFLYARVSTGNQSTGLEAQVRALREYCTRNSITDFVLFQDENQSGAKSSRPALDSMMTSVRNGECSKVIVYSFSRYARSVGHLLKALEEFKALQVDFISISEAIDTNSPLGRAFFTIIACLAQLERELIIERVRNGLANAKAKGIRLGREKKRDSRLIRSLRISGLCYREISRIARCSTGAVAAEIRQMKNEGLIDSGGNIVNASAQPSKKENPNTESLDNRSTIETPIVEPKLEIVRY